MNQDPKDILKAVILCLSLLSVCMLLYVVPYHKDKIKEHPDMCGQAKCKPYEQYVQ